MAYRIARQNDKGNDSTVQQGDTRRRLGTRPARYRSTCVCKKPRVIKRGYMMMMIREERCYYKGVLLVYVYGEISLAMKFFIYKYTDVYHEEL